MGLKKKIKKFSATNFCFRRAPESGKKCPGKRGEKQKFVVPIFQKLRSISDTEGGFFGKIGATKFHLEFCCAIFCVQILSPQRVGGQLIA